MEAQEVKMYSDYKSPFAYLAFDPAFALQDITMFVCGGFHFNCVSKAKVNAVSIPSINLSIRTLTRADGPNLAAST